MRNKALLLALAGASLTGAPALAQGHGGGHGGGPPAGAGPTEPAANVCEAVPWAGAASFFAPPSRWCHGQPQHAEPRLTRPERRLAIARSDLLIRWQTGRIGAAGA